MDHELKAVEDAHAGAIAALLQEQCGAVSAAVALARGTAEKETLAVREASQKEVIG
jgi:hypothetical protein